MKEELLKLIPEQFFVQNLKENTLGTIKIALLRETIGNAIIRSNYPDETITLKVSKDKDIVEIPARKLKAPEKLLGLKTCREYKVVDKEVRYNVIQKSTQLANPNSILFGDSVTESGDSVALTSRVIYDWAYSIRDVDSITSTLQHNALSEGGTMWNEEEGKLRQSLFQVQYVKPGTFFPHFVMVENVTPELFLHLLLTITKQTRYFAQSTTNSPSNLRNHILGIGFSKFEQPINSYIIAKEWDLEKEVNFENVSDDIVNKMKALYGEKQFVTGSALSDFLVELNKLEDFSTVYTKAKADCIEFLKDIKILQK